MLTSNAPAASKALKSPRDRASAMFEGEATRANHGASASSAASRRVVLANAAEAADGEEPRISESFAGSLSMKAMMSRSCSRALHDSNAMGIVTSSA